MQVSVVIATYNEEHTIEKCIESLANQSFPQKNYEILVVDGMSSDRTKEVVEGLKKKFKEVKIKIFENPKKIQAAAWNIGFELSKSEFVCMMGGHSFVDNDFIKNSISILGENPKVPCVGGIVSAIGKNKLSRAIALAFNSKFGVGDAKYRYATENCFVETVNYGMYRKSMIEKIGPIDEEIIRGQDWEYNYRIVKEFGKMILSPSIKVFYYSRNNFKKLWKKQFLAGYWKPKIVKKHPGSLMLRHSVPFVFSLIILLCLVLIILNKTVLAWLPLIIYFLTNLIVSLINSLEAKENNIVNLVTSFFILHFAYGLGSLFGLVHLFRK